MNLIIDADAIARVRQLLDIDLESAPGALADRFAAEPMTFVDVLYVILKPQCDASGVTDEQFGRELGIEGYNQFAEAFFPALANRPGLRQSARDIMNAAVNKALEHTHVE